MQMTITVTHKGTTFTLDDQWLYITGNGPQKVFKSDVVSPSGLAAFALGWVARGLEPEPEAPDQWTNS